jgi:signal peptidase I
MRRWVVWVVGIAALLAIVLFVFDRTYLLTPMAAGGTVSEEPTLRCHDRWLAEGFTYHFRSPKRGELVAFHASGTQGGRITPDPRSRQLAVVGRVVGTPGDQVEAHGGRVYVNGEKFDDIATKDFKRVDVGSKQYFVLDDNRSFSEDSRDFGPVPRGAIFGKVFLVYWPLSHFGGAPSRHAGAPPGQITCH